MATNKKTLPRAHWIQVCLWLLVIGLGIYLRMFASTWGHNFDYMSMSRVAEIANRGLNVYEVEKFYNYGPIWFWMLSFFLDIARFLGGSYLLHIVISAWLSIVDLLIFWWITKKFGIISGVVFFLNPISIIISGFHNQFDNFAILVALLATSIYSYTKIKSHEKRIWLTSIVLGISLIIKHVFIFFPFWLMWKEKRWKYRMMILGISLGLFFLSFVPYWEQGSEGIIANVFEYQSKQNSVYYNFVIPQFIYSIVEPKMLFALLMCGVGYFFRKLAVEKLPLWYGAVMLALSISIANQYLILAIPFVVVFRNIFSYLYLFTGTYHLLRDGDGLQLWSVHQYPPNPYTFYFPGMEPIAQLGFDPETFSFYPWLTILITLSVAYEYFPRFKKLILSLADWKKYIKE